MDCLNILSKELICTKPNEYLSKHTTIGIGGKCRLLVLPHTQKEICKTIDFCRLNDVLYTKTGNGSNLVVADDGFDGVVIKLGKNFSHVVVQGTSLFSQAGASGKRVFNVAKQHGLGGVEFLATLPATVGGAVCSNAGCFGKSMQDVVQKVWATDGMTMKEFCKQDIAFGYRDSIFKHNDFVITWVQFDLQKTDVCRIEKRWREILAHKKATQPLDKKSAGCIFKKCNGVSAGYYIDKLGLKGFCVGDAQISCKHAGFVVNNGGATSKQVIQLMGIIRQRCKQTFGITLEPEVVFLGSTDDFRRLSYTHGF